MNKSNITTKTISLCLSAILVAGTINSIFSFSSSFMTEVKALSDYGMMMRDNNDNYKSTKYLPSVDKKDNNIECSNFNLNLNGLDNVDAITEPLSSLVVEDKAQTEEDKDIGTRGAYYDGNDGKERFVGHNDKDFAFVCKNNNNNNNEFIGSPPIPPIVNNVCTVWQDNTPGSPDIFFARSTDGGLTFSEPENISENTGASIEPKVVCEGDNVYVVWYDTTTTTGNSDIFFARSTDGGLTFSDPKNISENTGNSVLPQISIEGDNVYVVWHDDTDNPDIPDIFFARSIDGGLTFSEPENISENTGRSEQPQISAEGNNVYIVWQDTTPGINFDIFSSRSIDGGLTFSEPENISENTEGSFAPQISSDGDNVYVVWYDTAPGSPDIFFARSTDGGLTFSDPKNISENTGGSQIPQISSNGNNVYVVWEDTTTTDGNSDIFFARSTDGGLTFSEPKNISESTGISSTTQISSDGDNVYVVWHDDTPGNFDIFFARSTNGGLTFSEPENLSENTEDSFNPQISSSSTSQENSNSEIQTTNPQIQTTNPQIQMTNPTQQTVPTAAFQQQKQQSEEDSPIITHQGTEGDSSALEKITKLKIQWLELLP